MAESSELRTTGCAPARRSRTRGAGTDHPCCADRDSGEAQADAGHQNRGAVAGAGEQETGDERQDSHVDEHGGHPSQCRPQRRSHDPYRNRLTWFSGPYRSAEVDSWLPWRSRRGRSGRHGSPMRSPRTGAPCENPRRESCSGPWCRGSSRRRRRGTTRRTRCSRSCR